MRCSALMTGFVKKNLGNAHAALVDRMIAKAGREEKEKGNYRLVTPVGSAYDGMVVLEVG